MKFILVLIITGNLPLYATALSVESPSVVFETLEDCQDAGQVWTGESKHGYSYNYTCLPVNQGK